jgi:glycosyltransferase involved in cell wall biosynthesis
VLIIDDCSPDDTPEVAAQLCAEDSRVEYRRHAVNRGHIATYNEGLLEWAKADYCLLLSADDALASGALQRAADLMDAHAGLVLCYGLAPKTSRPGDQSAPTGAPDPRLMSGQEFIELSCEEADNIVPTPTAVVRTVIQKHVGGYRSELPHSGDMEMWLRIAAHGDVACLRTTQAYYRTHGENMSVGFVGLRDLGERKAAFDSFFKEYGAELSETSQLVILAQRRLAETAFWRASGAFDQRQSERCRAYLSLAAELWPAIRRTSPWFRLRIKRLVGSSAWQKIRPVVQYVGRRSLRLARV